MLLVLLNHGCEFVLEVSFDVPHQIFVYIIVSVFVKSLFLWFSFVAFRLLLRLVVQHHAF